MKYNDNGLWKTLNVKVTDTLPVGTIMPYAGTTIPSNYMKCEGQELSRIEYDILFSAIGTTYGAGDGTTTFNLPNLKGRVITGIDSNDTDFDVLGEKGGEKTHTLTIQEIPSHSHQFLFDQTPGSNIDAVQVGGSSAWARDTTSRGGDQPHNIMQPYIVLNYIIKVLDAPATGIRSETLPVGTVIDYEGDTIPVGWEQIEETVLRKELTADASGNAGINWQNLGNLYLDLTPGTWYVKANAYFITTGVGIGFNKSCLSTNIAGGQAYTRLDSAADMFPSDLGSGSSSMHNLSCIVSVIENTRIYLLESFAYTGTNSSITLKYDTNVVSVGPSFIEARKLN
jgi:microcystin-dependent protein